MNEQLEDLFPFYALDALTEDERTQIDDYVASDPEAAMRLQEAIAIAGRIPFATPPAQPTSGVKDTLMRRVQADLAQKAALQQQHTLQSAPASSSHSFFARLRQLLQGPIVQPLSVAVAIVVVVVSLLQLSALSRQIDDLQAELAAQRDIVAIYTAPTAETIAVAGASSQPDASGRLTIDRTSGRAVLSVANLRSDPDSVYQLWYIEGDTPHSAGLFDVDATGNATYLVDEIAPEVIDAVGVSVEPPGGSEQPTGDIVLLGMSAS